jgi:hypothetical protein
MGGKRRVVSFGVAPGPPGQESEYVPVLLRARDPGGGQKRNMVANCGSNPSELRSLFLGANITALLINVSIGRPWQVESPQISPHKRLDSILTANEHCDFPATVWAVKIEPFEGSRPGRQAPMSFQWG